MAGNKRSLLRTLLPANGGCGHCTSPKPSDVYHPSPIPKISIHPNPNPSSLTSSSIPTRRSGGILKVVVHDHDSQHHQKSSENPISGKLSGSIAVEKRSEDPYNDFRDSMIQMIIEREIYSETDLRELLQWFLQLNSPCHHALILKAFSDICQEASAPS